MAYSYLYSFLFLMMPRGRKEDILYVLIIGIMSLVRFGCVLVHFGYMTLWILDFGHFDYYILMLLTFWLLLHIDVI
jgi:hypothetical protein